MKAAPKAQLALAGTHYRRGRFSHAEQVYSELHKLDPHNTAILTRLGEIALWKNQAEQAEIHFKAALLHAPWLQKKWPFSTRLNTLLAMTYYRQDRFQQAAHFFRQAAGSPTLSPFRDLKALATHLDLFSDLPPYLIEGPETTSLPFILTDPLPVIDVSINGSELVPFFIDTGGSEVIIDTDLAQKVGAQRSGTQKGAGGGTTGSLGLGKIDTLTLGDVAIHNLPIHIIDTRPFAAVFNGLPVKGVIGTRLLMHFLSTIDYPNARLNLARKTPLAKSETPSSKEIPFWLINTHYIVTPGTLNGKEPTLFFVDTGLAGIGFSAPEPTLRDAGVIVDWSKTEAAIGAFGKSESVDITAAQVTLGTGPNEIVAHNVPGVALKKPIEVLGYTLGSWIGGVVSHQFFRNHALTLDFLRMKLILHSNPTSNTLDNALQTLHPPQSNTLAFS